MKGVNKLKYAHRFDENTDWCFYSIDDQENDRFHNFLDPKPKWSLPYFEAFEFFENNP